MTHTAVLLVRPQARGRQSSHHRGAFAIEGRQTSNHKNSGPPKKTKVKCRLKGERSPMTRLHEAQDLHKENPGSMHCTECPSRGLCAPQS